jgi:hypothetical protein
LASVQQACLHFLYNARKKGAISAFSYSVFAEKEETFRVAFDLGRSNDSV